MKSMICCIISYEKDFFKKGYEWDYNFTITPHKFLILAIKAKETSKCFECLWVCIVFCYFIFLWVWST